MVDWRKDACKTMWFLSDLEREQRGAKLTLRYHNKKRTQNARRTHVSPKKRKLVPRFLELT